MFVCVRVCACACVSACVYSCDMGTACLHRRREGLQYSATPGLPELVKRLKVLQSSEHKPPAAAAKFDVAVTNGSQARRLLLCARVCVGMSAIWCV